MADRKITDLTALAAGSQATGDLLTIVDVSESAAADKNKKITVESLFKGIPGDVGIGTSSPVSILHVEESAGAAYIRSRSAQNSVHFFAGASNGGVDLGSESNHVVRFYQNNGEKMRIDSSGRLLLGTTTVPTGLVLGNSLTAASSTGAEVVAFRSDTSVAVGDKCGAFVIGNSDTDGTEDHFVGMWGKAASTNGSMDLHFAAGRASYEGDNPDVTIESGGNVGVGTTSPTEKLTVTGGNIQVDASSRKIGFKLSGNSNAGYLIPYNSGGNTELVNERSGSSLIFKTANTEQTRIDGSGRLLVGTSTNIAPDGFESKIQTAGTDYRGGSLSIRRDQNTASGPTLTFTKSRSTVIGGTTIVQDGDVIGQIAFYGADGGDVNQAAGYIRSRVDGTPGGNDMPGRLEFHTTADGAASPSERMRISNAGRVSMAHDGSYYNAGATLSLSASDNETVQVMRNTNASLTNSLIFGYVSRTSNSAFQYIKLAANAAADTDFTLRGDGNAYADGSWNAGGADYAEYFEWSDGNTETEDRRGISVVLEGDKIREAVAGEEPIGVISGNPSVVGDSDIDRWKGKYLRDDYGTYIQEDYEVEDDDGNTVVQQRRKLNPDYDPDTEYVTRENRPEWDTVGLMGKLRVRKGQITGTRWIKMRDVSDTVEEWLVR